MTIETSVNLLEILNTVYIKLWLIIQLNMTKENSKFKLQSYTQEQKYKFIPTIEFYEMLFEDILLKKVYENCSRYY